MRIDVIESDGNGGTTTRTAHAGYYWSTSATASLAQVTRLIKWFGTSRTTPFDCNIFQRKL